MHHFTDDHEQDDSPDEIIGADRKRHLLGRTFAPFIVDLVKDPPGCSTGAVLLYGALVSCLARYRKVPFGEGREQLAAVLGVSVSSVKRWISELRSRV